MNIGRLERINKWLIVIENTLWVITFVASVIYLTLELKDLEVNTWIVLFHGLSLFAAVLASLARLSILNRIVDYYRETIAVLASYIIDNHEPVEDE